MDKIFDMLLVKHACTEIFDNEASIVGKVDGEVRDIDLLDEQIDILADKIRILPDDYQEALISRMCFDLSAEEISEIFGISNPRNVFNSAHTVLGYSLSLKAGERISLPSLKKACNQALSDFVSSTKERNAEQPKFQNKKTMKRFLRRHKKPSLAMIFLKRAAIFVVGVLLCGVTVLTVNAAIREKFFNWVVTVYEKYSSFSIVSDDNMDLEKPAIDSQQVLFGYIPEGFELTEEYASNKRIDFQYYNQSGIQIFLIVTSTNGASQNLNTEDVIVEDIYINGNNAFFWIKNETTFIVWEQQGYLFSLITELNRETAIKIAENILLQEDLSK